MRKIIKKPSYRVRCYLCGCHFSFELDDFQYAGDGVHKVVCPNCSQSISITDSCRELLGKVKVVYESNTNEH